MTSPGVSAVVVSYNVKELLLGCLSSLEEARCAGDLDEIVVVDNSSSDGSANAVRSWFPEVQVIEAPNHGYGAGANRGIEATHGRYILVLNPDTTVPARTIARLSDFLDDNVSCAIAAPRMRYPDGTMQPSRRRFPTRLTPLFESTIVERWWPDNPWTRAYELADTRENEVQNVDWTVGACMLVRRDAISRAGAFDEAFWMYCEETEWCWRLRHRGWNVAYIPDVEITHHEGASSSRNVFVRQLAFDRSRIELQRRLYGRPTGMMIAVGIRLGYLLQLGEELSKFLLWHNRELRRERIRLYRRLLISSLRFVPGPPS